jgi:hypothetical protein
VKIRLLVFLFGLIAFQSIGQFPGGNPMGNGTNNPNNPNNTNGGFPVTNPTNSQTKGSQKSGREALDDSTKQIYGPQTMHFFLMQDVMDSQIKKRQIDTTLHLFHRYLFQERSGFLRANLGSDGTASRMIFTTVTPQLGTQLGYDVYSNYAFASDQIRYYDTKSPYSAVEFTDGAGGQTRLNFSFARNVDSLWNIGLELQRLVSDKLLSDDAFKARNINLTGQWGFLVHTNYRSRSDRYRILAHVNYYDHGINDQGGILLTNGLSPLSALKYADNTAFLTAAKTQSNDKFIKFHVYHEFIGFKGLQLFQRLDVESRQVKFRDLDFQNNLGSKFYAKTYINYIQAPETDSLYNENNWQSYSHQTGLKGVFRQFTYRAHVRQRYWSVGNPLTTIRKNRFENYLGIWLHQNFTKTIDFTAEGEYLLGSDYQLKAKFESPWFFLQAQRTSSSPSIAQNWMYNSSYRWDHSLNQISFDQLEGGISIGNEKLYFKPNLTIQRIGNWVYFDSLATVKQSKNGIGVFRTRLEFGGYKGRFEWNMQLIANTRSGPDVIRMPNFAANANVAVNLQYKKLLFVQIGLDVHYLSAYFGDAYMPAIQQFHLQDQVKLPAFAQVDPYLSLRINRVRLFFKYSNAAQGLISDNHYVSYLYPAVNSGFSYGVKWLLFD